ncbi:MAG: RNA polymerase recycling motor HelD [Cellulosilyticaceae bacterium]
MEAKKHSAYKEEVKQLKSTIKWVKGQSGKLRKEDEQLNTEIVSLRKEVSSALDERLLLKMQMQQMVIEDIDKLDKVELSPYFGRINFEEKRSNDIETIYIGKFGLYDSVKGDMLVLDWRAPMSNIYYSGLDEDVSYRTPTGIVEGKMHLKRRYVLNDGSLSEIHDEKSLQENLKDSITKDSGFLIDSLNKSTSGRLTEIVATIQDQQNKIIRSEPLLPLVVQGVAGSGKTTIALHRMAYIIYNRQHDKEAKYMVVAPNKLFLNYIEDILPDLGVDNVFQITFEEWALSKLDKSITLTDETDKLNSLLTESESSSRTLSLAAKLRGSMLFKRIIDFKLTQIERNLIDRQGIKFENTTLFTFKEIQEVFLVSNQHLPLQERIKQLGEYLKKRLKDKQSFIQSCIEMQYQRQINELKESVENIEEVRPEIINLYNERDIKIKGIKKWIPLFVKDYVKDLQLPTAKELYFGLFEEEEGLSKLLAKQIEEEELAKVIALLKMNYDINKIETEDLGPFLYIQMKLYGIKEDKKYSHIVVDEAQDLDEMKLTVLREVSLNDAFTLVGDLSQGIYAYKGITNWQRMMERVFGAKKYNYYEMTTSYRSTIEIIALANEVISRCTEFTPLMAEPVLRHGTKPQLMHCLDEIHRINQILQDIQNLKGQGMVSICVLTASKEEGQRVYHQLKEKGLDIEWVGEDEDMFNGNITIMPGYLAKGLEFDAVLIYDVGSKKDVTPLEIKLLYVMITRALHKLHMYSIGEETTLIKGSAHIQSFINEY